MDNKPAKGEFLETLLRSPRTIFSTKDVALLWGEEVGVGTRVRLNRYAKSGKLIRLRRGLYAKDKNYDRNELATKIFAPSYVSFETVLGAAGVTFQYYPQIFLASYQKRDVGIEDQKYAYRRVKEDILTSSLGIENRGTYSIASLERALLDVLYVNKHYHFDNLRPVDWEKIHEILPVYGGNERMAAIVKELESSARAAPLS